MIPFPFQPRNELMCKNKHYYLIVKLFGENLFGELAQFYLGTWLLLIPGINLCTTFLS